MSPRGPRILGMLGMLGMLAVAGGCAAGDPSPGGGEEESEAVGETEDAVSISARGVRQAEMIRIPQPAGMPPAWSQPDSEGYFDERGKCGPTAVANILRLYGRDGVSPDDAYEAGVRWVVGSRATEIRDYFDEAHPDLACRITHPADGPRFLRESTRAGRPVMAWFRTSGLESHWVTVVGVTGSGAAESAVVMSWGRYYRVPMTRFAEAWRNVYGLRNPAVVCGAVTTRVVR